MILEHYSKNKRVLALIVGILLFGGAIYLLLPGSAGAPETEDSWLARTDPSSGVSFRYPEKLTTKYISAVDWPPAVALMNGPFACAEAGVETERAGRTMRRMVDNREYCVTRESEGAAGSIYTNHAYAAPKDGRVVIFTFSTRAVQCANYDDPQRSECEAERESFDLDGVLDRVIQTAALP